MSASLAARIERLFRTHLNPKGREYSYREVAKAIWSGDGRGRGEAISATYVWGLRAGVKDNPTMKHLQGLARFFQVSPTYFFDEELTDLPDEARLLAATSRDSVRHLAVAALQLSDESVGVMLNLVSHLRGLEGLPPHDEVSQSEAAFRVPAPSLSVVPDRAAGTAAGSSTS